MTVTTLMSEFVSWDVQDSLAVITINRPSARNAINTDVATGIEAALDRLEASPDIWVGVLAAAPPVFCSGADLREIERGNAKGLATARGGFAGIVRRDRTKPLIAAVDGAALAGGTEIVLACDLIVASTRASFGLPEVSRGLIAEAGGLFRLGRKLPMNLAMEAALTGAPITAALAHQHGLVNTLCAEGAALETAIGLAHRICANAPLAVRESRRVILGTAVASDDVAWRLSSEAFAAVKSSADVKEGVSAFLEKRKPNWTGT